MVMYRGDIAGSSAEHPFIAIILTDLPFNAEDMLVKDERELKAGESLYLTVLNAVEKTVTIDGSKFSLEYNGVEIEPKEDGVISLTFTDVEYGEEAMFKITAKVDATEDLDIFHEGGINTPIYVYLDEADDLTQNIQFYGAGQAKYFSFANMNDFPCVITVEGEGVDITVKYPEGETADADTFLLIKVLAHEADTATISFTVEEQQNLKT